MLILIEDSRYLRKNNNEKFTNFKPEVKNMKHTRKIYIKFINNYFFN